MKKIKFVMFSLLFFVSCTTSKDLRQERKNWNFNNWKQEYKDRAFCLCLLKGYENKKLKKELLKNDKSFYSPLGIAIFDKSLESVINSEVSIIRNDSINSIGTYPDDLKTLYNKRTVLNHCIEFYNSERLNNLAKKQQKEWKKIDNIIDEIHKKMPTY